MVNKDVKKAYESSENLSQKVLMKRLLYSTFPFFMKSKVIYREAFFQSESGFELISV